MSTTVEPVPGRTPYNHMQIVTSGDELLRIDLPGVKSPKLTGDRKKAVNTQLLRFLANREKEDNELNRLVYMTIDYMPFSHLQDFISKALFYYGDWDLQYDRSDYLAVYKAVYEQQQALIDWHALYNRSVENYNLDLQYDRLDRKIGYNVLRDDYTDSFFGAELEDISINGVNYVSIVGIFAFLGIIFLVYRLTKKKKG